MTVSSWYFGSWDSVYFDILYTDSKLQRFKIIIKPDLSDVSLHFINMSERISDDLMGSLEAYGVWEGYRICEDALVYFWSNRKTWGAYTGLTSTPFTNVVRRWKWNRDVNSFCPTTGRFVYSEGEIADDGASVGSFINSRIVVVDLFWLYYFRLFV